MRPETVAGSQLGRIERADSRLPADHVRPPVPERTSPASSAQARQGSDESVLYRIASRPERVGSAATAGMMKARLDDVRPSGTRAGSVHVTPSPDVARTTSFDEHAVRKRQSCHVT